jgi:hypothetical protein
MCLTGFNGTRETGEVEMSSSRGNGRALISGIPIFQPFTLLKFFRGHAETEAIRPTLESGARRERRFSLRINTDEK